ncbi:MAG: helicase C-terminal domain-containing protein [bacterium]
MTKLSKYFSNEAINATRNHIREANGYEVFLVGRLNKNRLVESVEAFARGNETSAPALLQVAKQGDVVIHNHPSGTLRPSRADTHVASILGNDGIGFYIVNNKVSNVYVVVEPFAEKEVVPVNSTELKKIISQNGAISKKLENYEYRPQQLQMIDCVSQAINEDKIAIIEAGTGTGKTLAYLLPIITYAFNNKERCVVSTNTINLQEQLINKDLPFLQSILKNKFKAVLVKGRTNYACKRKLAEADRELDLFSEEGEKAELKAIIAWAKKTKDGSKSDLNFVPSPEVWEKIQSESDTSLRTKCPFYNECFFYTARRAAATANILVANHHLLFSDLAVRAACGASENAVLPAYHRIIFDEAHNLEDVATNYFGVGITYLGILRILNKLYRKKREQEKGLLPYFSGKMTRFARGIPHEKFSSAQTFIQEEGIAAVEQLKFFLSETMEQIFYTVQRSNVSEFNEIKLRLTSDLIRGQEWQGKILLTTKKFVQEIWRFTAKLNNFLRDIESVESKLGPSMSSLTIDLQAQLARLDAAANTVDHVLLQNDEENIRWIEVKRGYKGTTIVRLRSSPLEVAPILKEALYKNFNNILMTSATLTVEGKFDYLRNRLGLDLIEPERTIELPLSAPFDYKKQALVCIPVDIPDPREQSFTEVLSELILHSLKISRGRAFVLFTSYGLLNLMNNRLKSTIEALGFNVYKQGQQNRHRLLERFKEDTTSVLFATDSFWEGVDVHGEALESVIITKLPFKVPSEPVIEARVEAIERRGGNAFLEYTVPQAAVKFRQGFGRLIRRKTDRGSILILDKRVIQKSYGRVFLNSLPDCRIVVGPSAEIFQEMGKFFKSYSEY